VLYPIFIMAKKAMEQFEKKTEKELNELLAEKREALREFRFSMKGSRIRNTKEGQLLRKDIARILTLLGTRNEA
jgi:ribosomal protein L29